MKILFILPISWGGIPHYTAELANALSNFADVIVLKPKDGNDDLFSKNVRLINAFNPLEFKRYQIYKVFSLHNFINFFSYRNIRIIDEIKPDVLHFPELYPQASLFTFLYRLHNRYPIISTLHATFDSFLSLLESKNFLYGIFASITEFTKYFVKSDKIIVHSELNKKILVNRGIEETKIVVIPHGPYILFKRFEGTSRIREENAVLLFGLAPENKGAEYLVKAVPVIQKKIPDIKVIIAGEGDPSKYSGYIVDKSKFEIYSDFIPNEKVPELFSRAKIIILPYTSHQGHSGVLNIAFAFGKPVIVTDVGELPNLVGDGKEGIVIPAKNSEKLADAIITLLKNNQLRDEMGRNALKKSQELSWDNIAKMHMEIYKSVIDKRRDIFD